MALSIRRILVLCALCLFSLAALYPLFSVQLWYDNHDRDRYLYLLQEFKGIFDSGMLYPRWASRLLGGYGYPSFIFYQPGVFFFILPFLYLPLSVPGALTLAIFFMFLISALGCYRLARHFGMDRFVGALCSSIYLFMPYSFANLYIRGDLSEFFAMMLCPWVMVGVFRIRQELPGPVRWSSLIIYVLSTASVFLSHPMVALFMILIIGWFAVVDWIGDGPGSKSAWALAIGGLMAAVLTAPYWFTVLQLSPNITISSAMVVVQQAMSWGEIFYRTDANTYPWWIPTFGILSLFYVGLALIGLIFVCPGRLFWQVLPPLFFSIYMNTEQSLPLWHAIPGSPFVQFAWRIASVSGLLQYIAILQLNGLRKMFSAGDYHVAVVFVIMIGILFQPSVEYDRHADRFVLKAFEFNRHVMRLLPIPTTKFMQPFKYTESPFADTHEWDPLWMDTHVLMGCFPHDPDEPVKGSDAGVKVNMEKSTLPYRIRGTVDIDASAFPAMPQAMDELPSITMNQVYFPGWAESVDNQRINIINPYYQKEIDPQWKENPTARVDAYGRIQVFFPRPGHYAFDGYYQGRPHWLARNIIMCLLMAGLSFACIRLKLLRPLRE